MKFFHILIICFYNGIKSANSIELHENYIECPLICTHTKSLQKNDTNQSTKNNNIQEYHPQIYTIENSTQQYQNIDIDSNQHPKALDNTVTSGSGHFENKNMSDEFLSQTNLNLQNSNELFVKTKNMSPLLEIENTFMLYGKYRTLFNAYFFISTVLNNIISIYGLDENLKIDTRGLINPIKEDYSWSNKVYNCFSSINNILETNKFPYDVEIFDKIENHCHGMNYLRIYKKVILTPKEDLSIKFRYFRGLEKKIIRFDIKTKIKFLLEKIRTVKQAKKHFSSTIPLLLFLYEDSKDIDLNIKIEICVNNFIMKMISILKIFEFSHTQKKPIDFDAKIEKFIENEFENFVTWHFRAQTLETLAFCRNEIISKFKKGTYLGPSSLLKNWFTTIFLKNKDATIDELFSCLEYSPGSILHKHQNYIFYLIATISELLE